MTEFKRNWLHDENYLCLWRGCLLIYLTGYLIFLLLLLLSEMEYLNISDLWFFKKLRKNLVNMNSNWFLSTIVAYRYYNPVSWFPLRKKQLNHDPIEFTARKQRSVSDQWTRQDQKSLFKYIPNWANTLQWINSLHEKMKFARQFTYFTEKRIIMILLHR